MTSSATVSVALCTHNGSRFLEEQLASILAQTTPPAEVVVSDDASSDDTLEIVTAVWAALDPATAPRLVVLANSPALGVSANFEQAALACTGELIALCDQDDIWLPDRLERMSAEFSRRPDLTLLFTDAQLIGPAGESLGATLFQALAVDAALTDAVHSGDAFAVLLRRNIVTGATVLFRRELLAAAVPFDRTWVHDEWLAIIAAATGSVDVLAEPLIGYRQHGANEIGMAVPTLLYKIGRVFESRGDRYTNLLSRAEGLDDRLRSLGVGPTRLPKVQAKLEHQRRRAALPRSRWARIPAVAREARTGRYSLYSSQGILDVLRDLLGRA